MKPLIAIVGSTATGKSSLAIHLARKYGGEVISADSRQIYRYMDIGTAKISKEEQASVPHYLIDIKKPGENFSLAEYREMALGIIDDIHVRGKVPVLAGGTGQYVWGLLEGWEIPRVEPDTELRRELEEKVAAGGIDELYSELQEKDPDAAESIDPRNVRRVIRALEVVRQTDRPFSSQRTMKPPPFDTLIIGLTTDRKELYRRIDTRVDGMIEAGFVDEVKDLLAKGASPDIPAMSSIGYRQIVMYLKGEMTLEEAIEKIKTETHRLVRRQYNWFSLTDERIKWLDLQDEFYRQAEGLVEGFLRENKEVAK
ncbi:MAG: tRNA (adenosine(37)-N6)-dimethylallyltransferase MiaA [Dehalococcoidales bacterium]|nr:tRNA (adenosine(37)-N6)-dimethylallyltransferase MiaA [Dehalococcoidales bacterium]